MANEALSQREFDTWREGDTAFKQQMLEHMETQTTLNRQVEGRLSVVETQQGKSATKSATISTVVSAIVSGVVAAFSGKVV